ncbi:MAG: DNA primase, partial [Clostridia bacterium]|nr:DNA primase [Clostridia bacterium]
MDYQGFPAGWLDELKSKANLLQLVSAKVSLTRKGNLWWGCCPFHHEKTPSFAVDEARAFFHCYGCHEGGDVISWVQKTEALPFIDAVKYLAGTVGMKMPDLNPNAKEEYAKKERLYEMMRAAARHYYANYTKSQVAQDYWKSRGLSRETIVKFGLGYSVGGQALIDDLTKQGYTLREMQSCSLVGMSERDGSYYDFLAGRVIVPIFDDFGHVIAFGGRVLEKKEGVAKYKNSRETGLFQKARTLYGLNFVKKYRLKHRVDDIIVTEGYMDVIALVEAGFNNVVASMGTALTEQQAKMLKRLVERVYICYDGDAAGQSSTMRGLEILKRAGLDVRVMSLPDGLDPDEIIRRRGKAAYQECIDKALPLYEYKIVKAAQGYDLTSADGRSNYAKACLRIIADLDDVEREAYLTMISERSAVGIEGIRRMARKMAVTPQPAEQAPKAEGA